MDSKDIIKTFTNIDISYKVGDWKQFSLNDEKFGGYLTDTSTLKNMALSSDYKYDSYPEDVFIYCGAIEDVIEKAKGKQNVV